MIDFQIMGGYRDATFELVDEEYDLATTELELPCICHHLKNYP